MAWLILLAALACFAMAVLLPVGTGVVLLLLLAALALLLLGTTRLLRDRTEAAGHTQSRMLDDAEVQRVREALDARRQASEQ
jgi:membrane protein implicated in regulation of membrane protease activity